MLTVSARDDLLREIARQEAEIAALKREREVIAARLELARIEADAARAARDAALRVSVWGGGPPRRTDEK